MRAAEADADGAHRGADYVTVPTHADVRGAQPWWPAATRLVGKLADEAGQRPVNPIKERVGAVLVAGVGSREKTHPNPCSGPM